MAIKQKQNLTIKVRKKPKNKEKSKRAINKQKRKQNISKIQFLWAYLRRDKKNVWLFGIILVIYILFSISSPLLLRVILSELESDSVNSIETVQMILFISAYGIFSLGKWFSRSLQKVFTTKMNSKLVQVLRKDIYILLLRNNLTFFHNTETGDLTSILTNDIQEIYNFGERFVYVITGLIQLVLTIGIMFAFSPLLTIASIIFLPFFFALSILIRKYLRKVEKEWRSKFGQVNQQFNESLQAIAIAKTFGQEQQAIERFEKINEETYHASKRRGFAIFIIGPFNDFSRHILLLIILAVGSWMMSSPEHTLDGATFYMFVVLIEYYYYPLLQIARSFNQFQHVLAILDRILSLTQSKSLEDLENGIKIIKSNNKKINRIDNKERNKSANKENNKINYKKDNKTNYKVNNNTDYKTTDKRSIETKTYFLDIKEIKGEIEFKNLTFGYLPNVLVLKNISFKIKPGERIAIVGQTGAGKSTIASLLLRFYQPNSGSIMIDGIPIERYNLHDYRKHIGLVQQRVLLIEGTVRENLLLGNPAAIDSEIWKVLKIVQAEEFVRELKDGLDYKISAHGKNLSAGQRQMIAYARVLLSDPSIIILDEATSAVDLYTEAKIQKATDALLSGRTSIVIAHRLTTILRSDRIFVLENGKIIEKGDHQSLLKLNEKYAEMYSLYFKTQSAKYLERIRIK